MCVWRGTETKLLMNLDEAYVFYYSIQSLQQFCRLKIFKIKSERKIKKTASTPFHDSDLRFLLEKKNCFKENCHKPGFFY